MISLWHEISFREPLWLLLLLQPIVLLLLLNLLKKFHASEYSDRHLLPWAITQTQTGQITRYARTALLLIAWSMLAIAMAGPRLPDTIADQHTTTQRQLMVLFDVSPSMTARDVQPNRLQRAKLELLDLINRMQGTRMGIIVYGAQAHLLSPMTQDKRVLRHYVNAIHDRQLPTMGSQLDKAIELATVILNDNTTTPRALLIISDGENHADSIQTSKRQQTIAQLKQNNIHIYALGVGTAYGAPVIADDQGWLKHEGQTVNSRLQSKQLQQLTQLGNGRYSELRDSNLDWQLLYDEGIGRLQPAKQNITSEQVIWHEHYHGFLIVGVLCLLLGLWQPAARRMTQTTVLAFVVLINQAFVTDSYAKEASYQTAYDHLQNKDYSQAKQQFARIAGYAARLGEGSAAYYMEEYKKAAQQFTQALLDATTESQRGYALFNLANCQYQLNKFHAAEKLYQDVLRYLPAHRGAMINLEFVKALKREGGKSDRIAHRAGRGPQSGRLPDGVSTEGVRGITLGDDEDQRTILPDNTTTATSATTKTLQQAKAASRKVDADTDDNWQYRINSLEQLQQESPRIETNEATFWQRMFEQEEGFMAPVDQAHRLPEVKPW